jgi:hypothetical protein
MTTSETTTTTTSETCSTTTTATQRPIGIPFHFIAFHSIRVGRVQIEAKPTKNLQQQHPFVRALCSSAGSSCSESNEIEIEIEIE